MSKIFGVSALAVTFASSSVHADLEQVVVVVNEAADHVNNVDPLGSLLGHLRSSHVGQRVQHVGCKEGGQVVAVHLVAGKPVASVGAPIYSVVCHLIITAGQNPCHTGLPDASVSVSKDISRQRSNYFSRVL